VSPGEVKIARARAISDKAKRSYRANPKPAARARSGQASPGLFMGLKQEANSDEPPRKRANVHIAKEGMSFVSPKMSLKPTLPKQVQMAKTLEQKLNDKN
jgi:hypothetical protein